MLTLVQAGTQIQPRRKWFQLHLSTMILISLLAGTFLFANYEPGKQEFEHVDSISSDDVYVRLIKS